jgi:hypothetical protein
MSRRNVVSLPVLGAAFGLLAPTLLTVSEAEAQTAGMERRQGRRENRRERREGRRENRRDRREGRRENRRDRREGRRCISTRGEQGEPKLPPPPERATSPPYRQMRRLGLLRRGGPDDDVSMHHHGIDARESAGRLCSYRHWPGTNACPSRRHSDHQPARSTGPALFVGGWALAQLWLFWVAPLIGGALGRHILQVPQ